MKLLMARMGMSGASRALANAKELGSGGAASLSAVGNHFLNQRLAC